MYHSIDFTFNEAFLPKKLLTWPGDLLFPGTTSSLRFVDLMGVVLDLIRVWVLHDQTAKSFSRDEEIIGLLIQNGLVKGGHKGSPFLLYPF